MAELYGPQIEPHRTTELTARLPDVAELSETDAQQVSLSQLAVLLAKTRHALGPTSSDDDLDEMLSFFGAPGLKKWLAGGDAATATSADLQGQLRVLNRKLLGKLAATNPAWVAAYQLGLELHNTCLPPKREVDLVHRFHRHQLATLQGWLSKSGSGIPPDAAEIVSRSLQNWAAWVDANSKLLRGINWSAPAPRDQTGARPKGGEGVAGSAPPYSDRAAVVAALAAQSHSWRGLLAGEINPNTDPGVDGWIQAGESMLRTSRQVATRLLRRYWILLVVVLAVIGALLYLVFANTSKGDLTRFWASLVTLGGGLGITGNSLRTSAQRLAANLEQPAWHAASIDARAWAATILPAVPLGAVQLYRLRKRGVGAPVVAKGYRLDPERPVPSSPVGPSASSPKAS
jgi:hypothetical protein